MTEQEQEQNKEFFMLYNESRVNYNILKSKYLNKKDEIKMLKKEIIPVIAMVDMLETMTETTTMDAHLGSIIKSLSYYLRKWSGENMLFNYEESSGDEESSSDEDED